MHTFFGIRHTAPLAFSSYCQQPGFTHTHAVWARVSLVMMMIAMMMRQRVRCFWFCHARNHIVIETSLTLHVNIFHWVPIKFFYINKEVSLFFSFQVTKDEQLKYLIWYEKVNELFGFFFLRSLHLTHSHGIKSNMWDEFREFVADFSLHLHKSQRTLSTRTFHGFFPLCAVAANEPNWKWVRFYVL